MDGAGWARCCDILRASGARLLRIGSAAAAAIRRRRPTLQALGLVKVRVVIIVLLMLLLLVKMMRMLLVMLGRPCASVRSFIPRAPVQAPIPGVSRCTAAAVASRPVDGSCRAGWTRVEGARSHGEALMLIQRMVWVMQMMVVGVVSGFRCGIGTGPRSVTEGVFHKRVHVVHTARGGGGEHNPNDQQDQQENPNKMLTQLRASVKNQTIPLIDAVVRVE